MRKHIILFFSALLFLFACNDDKNTKDILDRQAMISVLVDVHLVDGALSNESNMDSLYRNTGRYFYVFKQHHTDSARFRKSMLYYTRQPDYFLKMYDDVIRTLQAKSDSMNKIVAKENEAKRKHMEAEQKKLEKARRDSAAKKGIKPPTEGLNSIDQQKRMQITRPQPSIIGVPGVEKVHSFKKRH
ncbi:MAG TPA: DUF4296 domain-containing protein [Mucilaginibacter sp.]|jgi:hypothetical protein|nr:DUF4296 domain-containing protein [Mucilaginibacter sp.]